MEPINACGGEKITHFAEIGRKWARRFGLYPTSILIIGPARRYGRAISTVTYCLNLEEVKIQSEFWRKFMPKKEEAQKNTYILVATGLNGLAITGINAWRVGIVDVIEIKTDRKSTRLNSSHLGISYAVFC